MPGVAHNDGVVVINGQRFGRLRLIVLDAVLAGVAAQLAVIAFGAAAGQAAGSFCHGCVMIPGRGGFVEIGLSGLCGPAQALPDAGTELAP